MVQLLPLLLLPQPSGSMEHGRPRHPKPGTVAAAVVVDSADRNATPEEKKISKRSGLDWEPEMAKNRS